MKIYTRTGDAGQTSIVGGTRLSKDAPRIEAYGTVDELNSHMGLLAAATECPAPQHATIVRIQNLLFNLGSYLAGSPQTGITDADIKAIEDSIDEMDRVVPPLTNFVLPGGSVLAARAHIARTVCRRAERRIVSIIADINVAPEALTLINRLSDWLYTFARYVNIRAEIPENFWQKPI